MRTFTPVVALMLMVLLVAPAFGGDEVDFQRALLEDAIDTEIVQSRQLASKDITLSESSPKGSS